VCYYIGVPQEIKLLGYADTSTEVDAERRNSNVSKCKATRISDEISGGQVSLSTNKVE
jgi:hypothetical protein